MKICKLLKFLNYFLKVGGFLNVTRNKAVSMLYEHSVTMTELELELLHFVRNEEICISYKYLPTRQYWTWFYNTKLEMVDSS